MTQIATLVCILGILGLYLLNRDPKAETSKVLRIPDDLVSDCRVAKRRRMARIECPLDFFGSVHRWKSDRPELAGGTCRSRCDRVISAAAQDHKNSPRELAVVDRYFGYCLVSVLWSEYPYVGFKRWIRSSGDIVMVLVILSDRDWLAARKKILAWPAFLLLPLSILFIRYYPQLGRAFGQWVYAMSWTGVSSTKNGLGAVSMVWDLHPRRVSSRCALGAAK